jgi:hypothetical protein
MSEYYSPKRVRGLYLPESKEPFRLSRSKIDLFMECQRCFYLDRRLGVSRPPGFPFALNSAVDHLLKKEFDIHRSAGKPHPLMQEYNVDAIPFAYDGLDDWRNNFKGVETLHEPTNFIVFGAVDDVWQSSTGELIVVDYKSTSKDAEVTLDASWQDGYKRQMEVYQWLLRQNDFEVSKVGYFVYANGKKDREAFDAKLEFDIKLIAYEGDDSWIENTLIKSRDLLSQDEIPEAGINCDYCAYRDSAGKTLRDFVHKTKNAKE